MHLQKDETSEGDLVSKEYIIHAAQQAAHPERLFCNPSGAEHANEEIREEPMGTKRHVKVIFMGFGISGLNFQKVARERLENVDIVYYEKNNDLGGTWYENRYPGCACDIPSVGYQFSWSRKPWSQYYSGSREIHDYLTQVAKEHDLIKENVKFRHRIIEARWLDDTGEWDVTVMRNEDPSDTFHDRGHVFLHGGGVLNNWRWPKIEGLQSFKGQLLHSAKWDDSVDIDDKRVLVIGAGSSGVQIVPNIIDRVKSLDLIVRSPVWITAGFAPSYAGPNGENFTYGDKMTERLKNDEEFYLRYCKAIESELNVRFKFVVNGSRDAVAAKEYSANEMERKLQGRKDLMDILIPKDFNVGCRRPTPGNGFLEALVNDKTTVRKGEIASITESGYVDKEGQHHEVGVIVCATGFDTSFAPAFPIYCNGFNLQDRFRNGDLQGYLGLSAPEVPNYWIFIGPYGPLGHGSVVPMVEMYTGYFCTAIEKIQTDCVKKVQVKKSSGQDFTRYADTYLRRTAWTGPCSSWFKNGDVGNKPVLWPGSRIHYLTAISTPRWEDYDFEYWGGNSMAFLGNGFDVRDFNGKDLTWYYGLIDGKDEQPKDFNEWLAQHGEKYEPTV